LYGTTVTRAAQDWRTVCVVLRRSSDARIPPCSAIERSRFITLQTVRSGSNQRKRYSHGFAGQGEEPEDHDLGPEMLQAWRLTAPLGAPQPRKSPRMSLKPVIPAHRG